MGRINVFVPEILGNLKNLFVPANKKPFKIEFRGYSQEEGFAPGNYGKS